MADFNDEDQSDPQAALRQKIRDAAMRKQWQGNMPGEEVDINQSNAGAGGMQPSQAGMPVGDAQQEAATQAKLDMIRQKMIQQDRAAAQSQLPPSPDSPKEAAIRAYLQGLQKTGRMR